MSHSKFGKFGQRQSDAPVYNPFGFNDTGWISPQYSFGSQDTGGLVYVLNNPNYTVNNDTPPAPVDETLQADNEIPKDNSIKCPQGVLPRLINGVLQCPKANEIFPTNTNNSINNFWNKIKQFSKENPVLATGIIGTITYIIFKGK